MMTAVAEQLGNLEFRRSAESLRKAVEGADASAFQAAVLKQHNSALRKLRKSMPEGSSVTLWSESVLATTDEDRALAVALKSPGKRQRAWIGQLLNGDALSPSPFARLAALELLARRGDEVKPKDFVRLYALSASGDTLNTDSTSAAESTPASEVNDKNLQDSLRTICEAEIAWTISLFLSELKGHRAQRQEAARRLRTALEDGTDTDGMLHGSLTATADIWLAPFVRASLWGRAFGESWTGKLSSRLSDCAAGCVSLLIPNGLVSRPPATLQDRDNRPAEILTAALRVTGFRDSSAYSRSVQSAVRHKPRSSKPRKSATAQDLSNQSDWAESAVMRSDLQPDGDTIAVNWPNHETVLHVAPLGAPLLSGVWESQITVNGKPVTQSPEWGCSCWFTDHEAAFVELESDPSESLHLVRHVMLSLKDRLAVFCESVTCTDADAEIAFESRLPLAADPLCVTNSITRELVLHADSVSTRVVPAWLDDDRIQSAPGNCEKRDDRLVSTAQGVGGVTIPLVFDWHPERQAKDADWTRLTVTEERRRSSGQQAAGFRVRIGRYQLFIYRSLVSGNVPRAVMGQHTMNETIYGRVKKSGEIAPLVLVEGELE